jgi:hypothetical protein
MTYSELYVRRLRERHDSQLARLGDARIELVEDLARCHQAIAAARRALARGNVELARRELESVKLPDWLEVPGRST